MIQSILKESLNIFQDVITILHINTLNAMGPLKWSK